MKTTTLYRYGPVVAALALLAGCHRGGNDAPAPKVQPTQAAANPAANPAAAQPGAQGGAGTLAQQNAGGGEANALGVPGASAAPAQGQANLQTGQQLATSGAQNGVTACAGCHGAQGEGNAAGGFPRIAGQSAAYLGKQLGAYANGARVNPIMQPIAKAMNAEQIRDVSAYYASLGDAPAGATAAGAPAAGTKPSAAGMDRGATLSAIGDDARGVQACANCHGPGGVGNQPVYPYLAGQHATYLTAAMAAWKNGARKTDSSGQMTHIAQSLPDADVAALSAYFSAQPAPPSAAKWINIPAGSSQRPAVAAAAGAPGPRGAGGSGGSTVRATGTEQGAPTTGGSQGGGAGGGTQATQPQQATPPVRR
ncbi:c-type cytochrome [Massilia luteola]|uniref:c-type cytochrome n=1 Tax=Massilia luteola TaxID=3081751 RepID=UPI002ACC374D|nr:c-type cytochrome [Massilia sp. Gc5]